MTHTSSTHAIAKKPLPSRKEQETIAAMQNDIGAHIPKSWLIGILLVCATPFLLNQFGVDFGTQGTPLDHHWAQDAPKHEVIDAQFEALSGAFSHTILEWSAFSLAAFVVFLSFNHYRVTRDITTPIIGIAFFMSGLMDAFHTLAADRLIDAVADNRDLIPFTWAICRLFNALILIAGVSILLLRSNIKDKKPDLMFVLGISVLFGVIAYTIINISATSSSLPQTTFPDAVITRPYDVLPLLLFIFAGVYVYPRLYKRIPSLFSYALMLSAIPEIVTQLHMTFGSTALFDNHFNIAHFLKVVAYFVPMMGLTLDFIRAHKILKHEILERERTEAELATSEAKQSAVINTMADAAITIRTDGIILSFNPAAETIFGYSVNEAIGQNVSMLMPEPYQSAHDNYLANYLASGESRVLGKRVELEACRKNGSQFPIELTASKLVVGNGIIFSAILRDVTKEKAILKMKDEFISTVSHELRTPITSIRGSLSLLAGGRMILPEKAQTLVDIAHNNSERLLLLINDLLDVEKLTSGKVLFNFSLIDIQSFVGDAITSNQSYAANYNVTIATGLRIENIFVNADSGRLMQVMNNLLSNAAKFSPSDGAVIIDVARQGYSIRVSVTDNGPGIPEEFQETLYDKFTQSDSSDTRQVGGTGLGLNIARSIIESHRGTIDFITEVGKGTTFYFDLPETIPIRK